MDPDILEHMCRTICHGKKLDPDATGYAVTAETKERLGATYKLWEYQIPLATEICSEFGMY